MSFNSYDHRKKVTCGTDPRPTSRAPATGVCPQFVSAALLWCQRQCQLHPATLSRLLSFYLFFLIFLLFKAFFLQGLPEPSKPPVCSWMDFFGTDVKVTNSYIDTLTASHISLLWGRTRLGFSETIFK